MNGDNLIGFSELSVVKIHHTRLDQKNYPAAFFPLYKLGYG